MIFYLLMIDCWRFLNASCFVFLGYFSGYVPIQKRSTNPKRCTVVLRIITVVRTYQLIRIPLAEINDLVVVADSKCHKTRKILPRIIPKVRQHVK